LCSKLVLDWFLNHEMFKVKKMNIRTILIILAFSLFPQTNLAQGLQYPYVVTHVKTIAGDLKIVFPTQGKWHLKLGDKIIFQDDFIQMSVLKHIKQKIAPFDEVVVLHRREGSYCSGGTFWFLGLKQDGIYQLSTGVGECFSQEPEVVVGKNFVKVTVKSGYGNNRVEGEPYLQGGTWFYENGQIIKKKAARIDVSKRNQLLKELKKCVHPELASGCDEGAIYNVAELYHQGDVSVLPNLMDVAPNSDGALSEGLGEFLSELLCHKPETFLRAVIGRPQLEQGRLLYLAVSADGSGMGCQQIKTLRHKLKILAQSKKHPLKNIARRCLVGVNKHNA
jgi:hypothetical protein